MEQLSRGYKLFSFVPLNPSLFKLQGCTSDVFKCVHLYVQFVELINENVNFTFPHNATKQELSNVSRIIGSTKDFRNSVRNSLQLANYTDFVTTTTESVLQVNIKGCGCKWIVT